MGNYYNCFRQRVYDVVCRIPSGRVMTYGDIAAYCGQPLSARIVGGIAHFGPSDLPWHRVVNRFGGLASGYWGGREAQKSALAQEGVSVGLGFRVDLVRLRWNPDE